MLLDKCPELLAQTFLFLFINSILKVLFKLKFVKGDELIFKNLILEGNFPVSFLDLL